MTQNCCNLDAFAWPRSPLTLMSTPDLTVTESQSEPELTPSPRSLTCPLHDVSLNTDKVCLHAQSGAGTLASILT